MEKNARLSSIKGVGEKTEKLFKRIGVESIGDLISLCPRRYDVFDEPAGVKDMRGAGTYAVRGMILKTPLTRRGKGVSVTSALIKDIDGNALRAVWFNSPFAARNVVPGKRYVFRGAIKANGDMYELTHPAIYEEEDYERLSGTMQPVYPLTAGLSNNTVKKCVRTAFRVIAPDEDYLPDEIRRRYDLVERWEALFNIHFPENAKKLSEAKKRLVFDEFFLFLKLLSDIKEENETDRTGIRMEESGKIREIKDGLPFELTKAQENALSDIFSDFSSGKRSNRLIQGDVGSGKTIVAFLAMINTALCGYQAAIMAPTEVLAAQHFETMKSLLEGSGTDLNVVLLTGSMKAAEKRQAREMASSGDADIIIGTHALIQDGVEYKNLALVVTDEQHRFGVKQREAFGLKGIRPHVIVMSATPIPRTLAIILYGDLDVTVIDELPAGRKPVKNCVVGPKYRKNAYRFIEKEVKKGHQAYVICPMIEENDAMEGEGAVEYAQTIRKNLPAGVAVEHLHGRMKPSEKNDIMTRFKDGEIDVLVSTTVIEVGIDVPNATVMMIENAERFGLSALHQLRGRIGRGGDESYCIFINSSESERAGERLEILAGSNDGFHIANEDLRLRGPGDFFGVRQSGEIEFKIGDIISDSQILTQAADAVSKCASGAFGLSNEQKGKISEMAYEAGRDAGRVL